MHTAPPTLPYVQALPAAILTPSHLFECWVVGVGRTELTGHCGLSKICPPDFPSPSNSRAMGRMLSSLEPPLLRLASSQGRRQVGWSEGQGRAGLCSSGKEMGD